MHCLLLCVCLLTNNRPLFANDIGLRSEKTESENQTTNASLEIEDEPHYVGHEDGPDFSLLQALYIAVSAFTCLLVEMSETRLCLAIPRKP